MTKSTRSRKKTVRKPGRPKAGGAGAPMVVRMHKPQLKALDQWISTSEISRPEAIRQLVTWALEHVKAKPVGVADLPSTVVKRAVDTELRRSS
jgi:hypothetical protein